MLIVFDKRKRSSNWFNT